MFISKNAFMLVNSKITEVTEDGRMLIYLKICYVSHEP